MSVRRTEVIQLRVSTEEKERISANAKQVGMKMSDWLRRQGLANYGALLEPGAHHIGDKQAERVEATAPNPPAPDPYRGVYESPAQRKARLNPKK